MASADLSRSVHKVISYPPLSELGDLQRGEFYEALLDADSFEDLPASGRRRSWRQSRTGRTSASSPATSPRTR